MKAYEKAMEWEKTGKIPIGVFYEEEKDTYENDLEQIKETALVDQPIQTFTPQVLTEEFV